MLTVWIGAAVGWAAPPTLTGVEPAGARRGDTVKLVINGANLTANTRVLLPVGFAQLAVPPADGKLNPARVEVKVFIDPTTPVGLYPIRVQTEEGVSNPRYFAVGAFAERSEVEENNTIDKAERIEPPVTIAGQVPGGDLDYFRFTGRRGRRVVVEAAAARVGSGADPTIRLITPSGGLVAYADDTPGLATDARIVTTLPADGDYIVEVHDARFRSGGNPVYRLTIGEYVFPAEVFPLGGQRGQTVDFRLRGGTIDGERRITLPLGLPAGQAAGRLNLDGLGTLPGVTHAVVVGDVSEVIEEAAPPPGDAAAAAGKSDSPKSPQKVPALPVVINGRLERPSEADRFLVPVVPGQKYLIEVRASRLGSQLDGFLTIRAPDGRQLATADDSNLPAPAPGLAGVVVPDPRIEFQVPADLKELVLELRDLHGRGGVGYAYRISVERSAGDFQLELADTRLNVPNGGTAAIGVRVTRAGYNGPIQIGLRETPAGLTAHGGKIAAGQNHGLLTVTAGGELGDRVTWLQVVGTGQDGDVVLRRTAEARVVLAQDVNVPLTMIELAELACGQSPELPIRVQTPPEPVVVLHGHSAALAAKLVRQPGVTAAGTLMPVAAVPPNPPNPMATSLPPGITAQNASIAENATDGTLSITAAPDAPVGLATVVFQATAKVNNADVVAVAPAVTIDIQRPFGVEGTPATIDLKARGEAKLTGKIVRRSPFAGAVQVRLDGLPAGVTANAVDVPADKADFELVLKAGANAAAATSGIRVIAGTKFGDKPYELPPVAVTAKIVTPQ